MNDQEQTEIFFHVGTGKTGSTFLQRRIFPKLKNIHYIPTSRYNRIFKLLANSTKRRILISREFDQQLESEVLKFSKIHPNTTAIIVFRRHDDYIASQYRRFVKNGFKDTFEYFFNLENDTGYFKKSDLNYRRQIEILINAFDKKPQVLLYDQLRKEPKVFIDYLLQLLDAKVDHSGIDYSVKHRSYSQKQLLFFRSVARKINLRKRRIFNNSILHFLWRIGLGSIRYTLLFVGRYFPNKKIEDLSLIKKSDLESIRSYYDSDWDYVLNYSSSRQPTA